MINNKKVHQALFEPAKTSGMIKKTKQTKYYLKRETHQAQNNEYQALLETTKTSGMIKQTHTHRCYMKRQHSRYEKKYKAKQPKISGMRKIKK